MDQYRTCVCQSLSVCGFYLFVGYNDGSIIKINTEKGLYNKDFKYKDNSLSEESFKIFTDQSNKYLLQVKDKGINQIDFYSGKIVKNIEFNKDIK